MNFLESEIMKATSLNSVLVLNTRPEQFSQYLVNQIERRGGTVFSLPTIQIKFSANPKDLAQILSLKEFYDWAIFPSRNAVLAVFECMKSIEKKWPSHLKCAAVGPKTAKVIEQLLKREFVLFPTKAFGAEGLLQLREMQQLQDSKVVVFDGGNGTGILVRELTKRCKEVSHQVVYSRNLPDVDINPISELIKCQWINFVVITSITGCSNLFQLLGEDLSNVLKQSSFVVYSSRIADYLKQQGCSKVCVASAASDDAVVELIERSSVQNKVIL